MSVRVMPLTWPISSSSRSMSAAERVEAIATMSNRPDTVNSAVICAASWIAASDSPTSRSSSTERWVIDAGFSVNSRA